MSAALLFAAAISFHGWLDGYLGPNGNHPDPKLNLADVVFVFVTIALFAAAIAYTRACEKV